MVDSAHLVGDDIRTAAGRVGIAEAVELAPSRGEHKTHAIEAAFDAAEDFAGRFRSAVTALRCIDPSVFVVHPAWPSNNTKVNLITDSSIFSSLSSTRLVDGHRPSFVHIKRRSFITIYSDFPASNFIFTIQKVQFQLNYQNNRNKTKQKRSIDQIGYD